MKIENIKIEDDIIYATIKGNETQIDTCRRLTEAELKLSDAALVELIYNHTEVAKKDRIKGAKVSRVIKVKEATEVLTEDNSVHLQMLQDEVDRQARIEANLNKVKNEYQEKVDEANNRRTNAEFMADQRFRTERQEVLERLRVLEDKVNKLSL